MTISAYLVEDSPVIQECIRDLVDDVPGLVLAGMADNEPQAVREILALVPDVVILDLFLTEGSGFGVLRHIRLACPDTRVFVLSNLGGPELEERFREHRPDRVFDKTTQISLLEFALLDLARERRVTDVGRER